MTESAPQVQADGTQRLRHLGGNVDKLGVQGFEGLGASLSSLGELEAFNDSCICVSVCAIKAVVMSRDCSSNTPTPANTQQSQAP